MKVIREVSREEIVEHYEAINEEPNQVKRMLGELPCNHIHYCEAQTSEGMSYYSKSRVICEGEDWARDVGKVRVLICDVCKKILVEVQTEYDPEPVNVFYNVDHEKRALIDDGHEEMYNGRKQT